jgi:hypothetical protein
MDTVSKSQEPLSGDTGANRTPKRVQLTIVGLDCGHDDELRSIVDALLVPGLVKLLLREGKDRLISRDLRQAAAVKKCPSSVPREGKETHTHQSRSLKTG